MGMWDLVADAVMDSTTRGICTKVEKLLVSPKLTSLTKPRLRKQLGQTSMMYKVLQVTDSVEEAISHST
jgi:hypothetical protein